MNKNLRTFLLSFVIICTILVISYVLVSTYSRYRTTTSGTAEIAIARWNIKVNDESIKSNTDLSQVIQPRFPGNSNISANVIAPTATGYFDLEIDYSEADVSFDYTITVTPNENSLVSDLVATSYSIDGGTPQSLTSGNTITGTALNSAQDKTFTITVNIMWDDATGTMDNAADTNTTLQTNSVALLDVNISFVQNNYAAPTP